MYTSSAVPTSIPSSGVVTRGHSTPDARVETRRQDTTDGFPVGLIPQLIDVLTILTEGQGLLSGKIRAARLNESSHSIPIVEQLNRLQIPVGQPVVVDSNSTSFETRRTRPAEHSEKVAGEHSSGPAVDPVPLESATLSGTTTSPMHRDYNFFDELDERLASLQDPNG
jgi:hypothetical protein